MREREIEGKGGRKREKYVCERERWGKKGGASEKEGAREQ